MKENPYTGPPIQEAEMVAVLATMPSPEMTARKPPPGPASFTPDDKAKFVNIISQKFPDCHSMRPLRDFVKTFVAESRLFAESDKVSTFSLVQVMPTPLDPYTDSCLYQVEMYFKQGPASLSLEEFESELFDIAKNQVDKANRPAIDNLRRALLQAMTQRMVKAYLNGGAAW
jgi:hypothetical protein